MQERKWKVGGKYRLVDVVGFTSQNDINGSIALVLGNDVFTVKGMSSPDQVDIIEEYSTGNMDWSSWFDSNEIKYFEEITEDISEPEQSPTQDNTSAVVEWLDKFLTVAIASPTNESICVAFNKQLCLETIHGNVHHTQNIVDSINNRYSHLVEQANKSKREELLAEIVKAKEVYEKLVGELNELEKG